MRADEARRAGDEDEWLGHGGGEFVTCGRVSGKGFYTKSTTWANDAPY